MWGAIQRATGKVVLIGDVSQLPPTVISQKRKTDLSVSPMERLFGCENTPSVMLTVQHRSAPQIMAFPSQMFYHGKIESAPKTRGTIADMFSLVENDLTTNHLVLVPTCDMPESTPIDTKSYANVGECQLVRGLIRDLIASGVSTTSIGVATPYSGQVSLLVQSLEDTHQGILVSTIDKFQGTSAFQLYFNHILSLKGSERDVIIVSTVRSNGAGRLGFLSDPRRVNVAMTRAKKLLILVCDTSTLGHDPLLQSLIEHFRENGVEVSPDMFLSE